MQQNTKYIKRQQRPRLRLQAGPYHRYAVLGDRLADEGGGIPALVG